MTFVPTLIIHGGAGRAAKSSPLEEQRRKELYRICESAYHVLLKSGSRKGVLEAIRLLEDFPLFNAGTGSTLQSDGVIRMSASLMNGSERRFAAVINIERVKNPILVADLLLKENDRILACQGAALFAREHGFPDHDPVTPERKKEWEKRISSNEHFGTVGAVALDAHGHIYAGTSTGGKGAEWVGRVSDTAMPAGNYATGTAGISSTGIGEDIVDESLATILACRAEGDSLKEAFEKTFAELRTRKRKLGAIGLDRQGNVAFDFTTEHMLYCWCQQGRIEGY